jgi:hypothetical protein
VDGGQKARNSGGGGRAFEQQGFCSGCVREPARQAALQGGLPGEAASFRQGVMAPSTL